MAHEQVGPGAAPAQADEQAGAQRERARRVRRMPLARQLVGARERRRYIRLTRRCRRRRLRLQAAPRFCFAGSGLG